MEKNVKALLVKALGKHNHLKLDATAADRNIVTASATLKGPDDLYVRKMLVGQGEILEENLEKHTYIAIVNVGGWAAKEALVATLRDGSTVWVAAYAKEGLIKQHLAQKAIDQIIARNK